ncbi:hypothetical protein MHYP_G00121000 [Metynnis hypsauchen]
MSNPDEYEGEVDLVTLRRRRGQAKAAEAHRIYHDRLTDETDKEESEAYEKVILMSVHDVRHDALAWLQEVNTSGEVDDQLNADELDSIDQNDPVEEAPDGTDDDNPVSAELENLRALRKKEQENFELLLKHNKEELELELQRMRHKAELDAQMLHNKQRIQAATTDLYSTPKVGKSPSITRPSLSPIAEDSISQLLEFSRQQYQAQVDSLHIYSQCEP